VTCYNLYIYPLTIRIRMSSYKQGHIYRCIHCIKKIRSCMKNPAFLFFIDMSSRFCVNSLHSINSNSSNKSNSNG